MAPACVIIKIEGLEEEAGRRLTRDTDCIGYHLEIFVLFVGQLLSPPNAMMPMITFAASPGPSISVGHDTERNEKGIKWTKNVMDQSGDSKTVARVARTTRPLQCWKIVASSGFSCEWKFRKLCHKYTGREEHTRDHRSLWMSVRVEMSIHRNSRFTNLSSRVRLSGIHFMVLSLYSGLAHGNTPHMVRKHDTDRQAEDSRKQVYDDIRNRRDSVFPFYLSWTSQQYTIVHWWKKRTKVMPNASRSCLYPSAA